MPRYLALGRLVWRDVILDGSTAKQVRGLTEVRNFQKVCTLRECGYHGPGDTRMCYKEPELGQATLVESHLHVIKLRQVRRQKSLRAHHDQIHGLRLWIILPQHLAFDAHELERHRTDVAFFVR